MLLNSNLINQTFGTKNRGYYNVHGYIYHYDGILFYTYPGFVESFKISNSNYTFTEHNIKVGDNISSLEQIYPLSYAKKGDDFLSLWITNPDYKFISITFNSFGTIQTIGMYSN